MNKVSVDFHWFFLFVICLVDLIMDSQITEVIGWLGFALVSIGYYLNAKKKLYCFIVWGIGNARQLVNHFDGNGSSIRTTSVPNCNRVCCIGR